MRRRQLAATAAAAIVLVGGGITYAQAQGESGSYRTASVVTGDVDKTLGLSGVVAASSRQDLSFGVAGTVSAVKVAAGDEVRTGDVLARIDPSALEAAVTKATATLAKARAQLETDQNSQADAVSEATTPAATPTAAPTKSTPTATPKSTPTPSTGQPTTTSPALEAALKKLAAQQADVTTAQTAATETITTAKSALATQIEACKAATEADPVDPALTEACSTALDAVQAAQDVVAQKQDVLQKALETLSATLSTAVKEAAKAGETGETGTKSTTPTPTATPTPKATATPTQTPTQTQTTTPTSSAARTPSGGGGTVTAASLAKDQAAIDTAKAQLTEARRALKSAKLTAPFSGEILSVSAAKGDAIGESDVAIVIVGDGATTVTTTVTLEQVDDVERGQTAAVTPAGAADPVSGTVTSIGLLPTTGTDTSTYPVTIELDGEVAAPEGSTASIQVTIGTAADVLTVPSSAVSTTGRTTVSVLEKGRPVITPVTIGVVGPTRTSITEGVKKGQKVILADLGAELPSGDSTTTRLPGSGRTFGGGGTGAPRPPSG